MNQCPPQQPCYPKEFYQKILGFLCAINNNLSTKIPGVYYDIQVLCDPSSGEPVFVRTAYNTDGTAPANNVQAFTPTGTAYIGVIADLVSCGGSGGGSPPGGPYRFDYEVLCDPLNGGPVLLQIPYNINGTVLPFVAFNSDGTPFAGAIGTLIACNSIAGGSTRFDYETLCNPATGVPVIVRASYNINGVQNGFVAYNLDGTAYSGDINLLVGCGGEGSVFNGWNWVTQCDPLTGQSVYVRITYGNTGNVTAMDGFYGDMNPYLGDVYNLVDCAALNQSGDGLLTWNPNPTPSMIIPNPGVGLQTAQGTLRAKNAIVGAGGNPNNYSTRSETYRMQWKEIDDNAAVGGPYDMTVVNKVLDDARASLQVVNLRIQTFDPSSVYCTPDYMYNNAGWQATHDDDITASTFKLAWWGNAANIAALLALHTAVAAAINTHPAFDTLDAGWGAFDENNYSGTHYIGTRTGGATDPGGDNSPVTGNPLPDLTLIQAQTFFGVWRTAYGVDRLIVMPVANQISFDYGVGVLKFGARMDGWGYRNNPASCPAGGVQMCTDAVNTFMPTGSYPNTWQNAPVMMETWDYLYGTAKSWLTLGYDYAASFNWAISQAKVSAINPKGRFDIPNAPMKAAFEAMLLHLGYRFTLLAMSRPQAVDAGSTLAIKTSWQNTGNAPIYRKDVVSFRLYDPVTGLKYYEQTPTPASSFAVNTSPVVTSSITVPSWFPSSNAQLSVSLALPLSKHVVAGQVVPEIWLSNDGNLNDFWYSFPTSIQVRNPSPAAVPGHVFAATMNGTTQFLSSTSPLFRLNGTDFTIACTVPAFTLGAVNRAFVSKGFRNTANLQEYWVGYNSATDRIEASFSNGTTIYRVAADNFGPVSTQPSSVYPLKVLVEFSNVGKILAISVNASVSNTVTGTGSILPDSNTFRIGNDSNNNFLAGQITSVGIWKLVLLSNPTYVPFRNLLLNQNYLTYPDLPNQIKYGMYYWWDMTEATGSRIDSNCGRGLTDNGGVTRTAVA